VKKHRRTAKASILDRLIDEDLSITYESVVEDSSIGKIKSSVARDLENLLNSRRSILVPPFLYKEVNTSLFVYGLPDFTSRNPGNVFVRSALRLEIEKTITLFEPRLNNISVEVDSSTGANRELKFRITGVLVIDHLSEPVVFDTNYDMTRSNYTISK